MTRYRLRVALVGSDPEIWRTFDIDGNLKMRMLHLALQLIMGWRESHLHAFTDADPFGRPVPDGRRWESPDFEDAEEGTLSEEDFSVDDVFAAGGPIWYEYDFGDGWTHRLDVVEHVPDERHLTAVVLIDGGNRGPFEDSGGLHGYYEKLAIAADPQHPEHDSISDWIDTTVGPWAPRAPGAFDLVALQSELNLLFNAEESGMAGDMSGIVKIKAHRTAGDVDEASPIASFVSELPPPIRSELRQHLDITGVLAPVGIDADTAARIVRPFAWLMQAVGADGLTLTSAGWMPPATVLAGMTELGWLDEWIGKGNREDLTPPMANLREAAQRMGIVRVQKGRLLLSVHAKKALGDPVRQLRLVATGLYRKLSDAETDAAVLHLLAIADGTPPEDRWRSVAFGLEMCGWQSSSGWRFTKQDIGHAAFRVQQVLDQLGEVGRRARYRGEEDPHLALFAREALR